MADVEYKILSFLSDKAPSFDSVEARTQSVRAIAAEKFGLQDEDFDSKRVPTCGGLHQNRYLIEVSIAADKAAIIAAIAHPDVLLVSDIPAAEPTWSLGALPPSGRKPSGPKF